MRIKMAFILSLFYLILLLDEFVLAEMIVQTTDGKSFSVPVKRNQIRSIEFTEGRFAGQYPERRPESFRILSAVASQNTNAFRLNPEHNLVIETSSGEKTPFRMTASSDWDITLEPGQRCYLSGDPEGRTNWAIDNFLLLEIRSGRDTRLFVLGATEPVFYRGQRIEHIGPNSTNLSPDAIDLCAYLPKGLPFKLKASAFDYGGLGYVSNLFLIMQ